MNTPLLWSWTYSPVLHGSSVSLWNRVDRVAYRGITVDLPHRHRLAVERVVHLLVGINWALTGSLAHRLQGVDVECGDIDIQTDEPGAYAAGEAMRRYVVNPVRFRRSANMTSHFGHFRFDDLDVDLEVMGAIDKLLPDGSWTGPIDPSDHVVEVTLGDRRVPVLSLEYEADAYETLRRHGRAQLIREHLG